MENLPTNYNLNTLVKYQEEEESKDSNSNEYIDVDSEEEFEQSNAVLHYQVLRQRYSSSIPSDIFAMLNQKKENGIEVGKSLARREPSPLVQYLIFSNIASFMFYYRLWNGRLTVENLTLDEAKSVCLALLTQLLSKDSQEKVKQDHIRSAYFLDHLYYLSLFKDANLLQFQQVVLTDLESLFCFKKSLLTQQETMHPKTSLVEGLLRYYDFINDVESHLLQSKVGKHLNKTSQTLLK